MTIGTNDLIDKFGTQDTVTAGGGTSAVSASAFSASGDVVSGGWTNDDDAPLAAFVLTTAAGQAAWTAGDTVQLYARLMNINSTADAPQPGANFPHVRIGSFKMNAASGTQDVALIGGQAALPNQYSSQIYEFYIENLGAVSLAAGWTLKVTPISPGPHA